MGKKHDENKDLRLVARKCKVNYVNLRISAPRNTIIGNRVWGRIDFLVNHCGWRFVWDDSAIVVSSKYHTSDKEAKLARKREAKRLAKENTMSDKPKRKR